MEEIIDPEESESDFEKDEVKLLWKWKAALIEELNNDNPEMSHSEQDEFDSDYE